MKTEDSLETIAKGATIMFVGLIISKLFGYIYKLIIARIGPEEYGLLSLGIAIFGFITIISIFGLDFGVLRYVSYYNAKYDDRKVKGTILSALKINIVLSLILGFLLFISADKIATIFFHSVRLGLILKIVAIAIPFDGVRNILINALKGYKKARYEVYSKTLIEDAVKVGLTVFFLYLGYSIYGAIMAFTFAIFISMLITIYFAYKVIFKSLKNLIAIKRGRILLSYSWPLLLNSLLICLIVWIDTILIGYFRTASEVGLYDAAAATGKLMLVFPHSLVVLFLPVIAGLYVNKDKISLNNTYSTVMKWVFMINFAILMVFIIFSKQILGILFGTIYASSAIALILLSIGHFFNGLSYTSRDLLMIFKRTKLIFIIGSIGVLLNIILDILLIPKYGVNGAAIATMIVHLLIFILMIGFATKLLSFNPIKLKHIKIIISTILCIILTNYLIRPFLNIKNIYMLVLGAFLIGIIFSVLLIITRSFDKQDLLIIEKLEKRSGFKLGFINKILEKFIK